MTVALLSIFLLLTVAVHAGISGVLEGFTISPNPMDKVTNIVLTFNQPANIGVNIETESGIVLKNLYWGPVNNQMTLTWNRLGDNGVTVPPGKYVVVVNHEGRYTSTKKTLILK